MKFLWRGRARIAVKKYKNRSRSKVYDEQWSRVTKQVPWKTIVKKEWKIGKENHSIKAMGITNAIGIQQYKLSGAS